MKTTSQFLLGLALLCLTTASLYSADAAVGDAKAASATQTGAAAARDTSWRYVYHQGHWWFLRSSGSWDYYDGQRWVAYDKPRTTPSANLARLQADLAKAERSVQRLESRRGAPEQLMRNPSQASGVQAAEVSELWQARQRNRRFYNFGTDAYYFRGKGHFVD